MRRNINNTNLNKNYILSKVSQIKIFSVYLGIPEQLIQHCVDTGELICSTLRIDNHPTVGFKYDNRGKLKYKDFSGFLWGDCFDIAAYVISGTYNKIINVENKRDFIAVLKHIALTFSDIIYGTAVDPNLAGHLAEGRIRIQKSKPIIEFVNREWNTDDITYWGNIGVDINWLNTHFIYAVDQYYINRRINPQPKYYYDSDDPCYAYVLGRDSNGIHNIKLYFPKRDKKDTRFITNCNHLEGIYNLERDDYDYIIIDCPPSLNMLTVNAMTTADTVLVPIQCEYYALEGLSQLIHTINLVQERLNPNLQIEGIVFTMYDVRTNLSNQVVENVKENLDAKIYETMIPRNIRLAEAPSYGLPINMYDSKSAGAESYRKLAKEIINRKDLD